MAQRASPAALLRAKRLITATRAFRAKVERTQAPSFAADLGTYFTAQAGRLVLPGAKGTTGTKALPKEIDPLTLLDWEAEDAKLLTIVESHFADVAQLTLPFVGEQLGLDLGTASTILRLDGAGGLLSGLSSDGLNAAFNLANPYIARVMDGVGVLVKGLNADSQKMLQGAIESGIAAGDGPAVIAGNLSDLVAGWSDARSLTIARTETAHAYNWAATAGYRDSGIVPDCICLDSPECGWDGHDDPELADGTVRSLDEAEEFPTSHPNCVRAFAPNVDTGAGQLSDESAPADTPEAEAAAVGEEAVAAAEPVYNPETYVPPTDPTVYAADDMSSDAATSRINALGPGETPDIYDVVAGWQVSTFGEIRAAAAGTDSPFDMSLAADRASAKVLMDAVNTGYPANLARGITVDDTTYQALADLRRGTPIDMNLSSWTDQGADTASVYAAEYPGDHVVIFQTFGAKGLPVSDYVPSDSSGEWITDGRFTIVRAPTFSETHNALIVELKQQSTFTAPEQFLGTKAKTLALSEASFGWVDALFSQPLRGPAARD